MRMSTIHVAWHQGAELHSGQGDDGLRAVAIRTGPTKASTAAHASRLETAVENDFLYERPCYASVLTHEIDCTTGHVDVRCLESNWQESGQRV